MSSIVLTACEQKVLNTNHGSLSIAMNLEYVWKIHGMNERNVMWYKSHSFNQFGYIIKKILPRIKESNCYQFVDGGELSIANFVLSCSSMLLHVCVLCTFYKLFELIVFDVFLLCCLNNIISAMHTLTHSLTRTHQCHSFNCFSIWNHQMLSSILKLYNWNCIACVNGFISCKEISWNS